MFVTSGIPSTDGSAYNVTGYFYQRIFFSHSYVELPENATMPRQTVLVISQEQTFTFDSASGGSSSLGEAYIEHI
jgi:hypothetical protein